MCNDFSYSLTYSHVTRDDHCQVLSGEILRSSVLVRQICQPSGQHFELSAGVHGEQRGDPADAGRHEVLI